MFSVPNVHHIAMTYEKPVIQPLLQDVILEFVEAAWMSQSTMTTLSVFESNNDVTMRSHSGFSGMFLELNTFWK